MLNNCSICGHRRIISALQKNIRQDRLAHAYLFSGPEAVGKKTVALNFVKTLQCEGREKPCGMCQTCFQIEKNIHPDTIIFQKDITGDSKGGQEIKIFEMRDIQKKMSLKQYSAPYKILLLDRAENLNDEAANSLLKFLEEPKGKTLIILITNNINMVLPTIISRCVTINFLLVPKNEMLKYFERKVEALQSKTYGAQNLNLEEIINYSLGRPGNVIRWLENPKDFIESKEIVKNFAKVVLADNITEKFKFISQFYNKKEESIKLLMHLLMFYQHLLSWQIGREDLEDDKEIRQFARRYEINKIRNALFQIISAKKFILQNANLKLVLENMMLNIGH
ncbi:MAG: AAA family ATPase [Patescibacteria group bacterium]